MSMSDARGDGGGGETAPEVKAEVASEVPLDLGGGPGDATPEVAGDGGGDTQVDSKTDSMADAKTDTSVPVDMGGPGPMDLAPEMPPACSCTAPKICSGSSCVCPAVAATPAAGAGCSDAGAKVCGDGAILTCTTDAGSGCKLWAKSDDCGATGLVCTGGGAPACACAPVTNEISVDPVAGSDTAAGVTGAANPPACRYKTLGKALAVAAGRPLRIVARSATRPAVFEGESFPLTLPAGVTMSSDDANLDPAAYRLAFRGPAAAAMVALANGAALEGFTLEATAAAEHGVVIAAGSARLKGVRIVAGAGGSLARGLAVGTDQRPEVTAVLERVTIERATVGLFLNTRSLTAVNATTLTIEDAGTTGVELDEGSLTANGLTVQKSATGTAGFGVLMQAAMGTSRLDVANILLKDLSRAGIQANATAPLVSAPEVTLTGGEITRTTESGVDMEAGRFKATGTNIHGTQAWGLEVAGQNTNASLEAGTKVDGNRFGGIVVRTGAVLTGTGISASNNRVGDGSLSDGLHVEGGMASLSQSILDDNEGRAVYIDGGSASVGNGSLMRGNGRTAGSSSIRHKAGDLTLGGGALTEISGSGRHGIYVWTDEGVGSGSVTVTNVKLSGHLANGLFVDVVPTGASAYVQVSSSEISGNEANGVRVDRAPSVGNVPGVRLSHVMISSNGKGANDGNGVVLNGVAPTSFELDESTVRENRSTGIVVQGSSVNAVINDNDILGNNKGGDATVGGVLFAGANTVSFRSNDVHSNTGHEVGFSGGGNWTLGSGACDAAANRIWCYGGASNSGKSGIYLSGNGAAVVNAGGTSWSNASPAQGTDWSRSGAGAGMVMTAGACTPVPTCP